MPAADQSSRRIAILLLPSLSNLTLAGLLEPLRVANRLAGQPLFAWTIATVDGRPVASCGFFSASAFACAFRDRFGTSPTAFRRQP